MERNIVKEWVKIRKTSLLPIYIKTILLAIFCCLFYSFERYYLCCKLSNIISAKQLSNTHILLKWMACLPTFHYPPPIINSAITVISALFRLQHRYINYTVRLWDKALHSELGSRNPFENYKGKAQLFYLDRGERVLQQKNKVFLSNFLCAKII